MPIHRAHDNNMDIILDIQFVTQFFENHSSICQIKEHYSNNQSTMLSLYLTIPEEVKVLLGAINSYKTVGFEDISPNLVKQAT